MSRRLSYAEIVAGTLYAGELAAFLVVAGDALAHPSAWSVAQNMVLVFALGNTLYLSWVMLSGSLATPAELRARNRSLVRKQTLTGRFGSGTVGTKSSPSSSERPVMSKEKKQAVPAEKPFVIETPPRAFFAIGQVVYSCEDPVWVDGPAKPLVTAWTVLYVERPEGRGEDSYTLVRHRDQRVRDHASAHCYHETPQRAIAREQVAMTLELARLRKTLAEKEKRFAEMQAALDEASS